MKHYSCVVRRVAMTVIFLGLGLIVQGRLFAAPGSVYSDITAASYLGGTLNDDSVRGAVIQDDGTIVLSANIGGATPGGLTPTLLNGATGSSSGAIIRLNADGTQVLSVTRVANMVLDMDRDSAGNLYVALFDQGMVKLNSTASQVLWAKTPTDLSAANIQRIDAGPNGTVAMIGGNTLDNGSTLGDEVRVFSSTGTLLGSSTTTKWKHDVAIHEPSQTVIYIGYRNATDSASGFPVQICYFRGIAYDGTIKYNGYDFSSNEADDNYLNEAENNMADTRGHRATIGDDGYLYLMFESAGGNNVFNHNPFNNIQNVAVVQGDFFQNPFNLTASHITFVGRYNAANGNYVTGTHLLTRTSGGQGNKMGNSHGALAADADGRVYLGGDCAWGLPIPGQPDFTFNAANPALTPGLPGDFLGGSHFVIMNSDFATRHFVTRLTTSGSTRAIAVRSTGSGTQVAFGGDSDQHAYQLNAIQATRGSTTDGWFGVIESTEPETGNSAPNAAFSTSVASTGEGTVTLNFNASASTDPDADALEYIWAFGDGNQATGASVQNTFDATSTTTVTLIVRDNKGGWSYVRKSIGAPNATFVPSTLAAVGGQSISFDASASSDPDHLTSELTFEWDFGDGTTATGQTVSHTYAQDGVRIVNLRVIDPLGGYSEFQEVVGVTMPGSVSKRFDFDKQSDPETAPGFTSVSLDSYNSGTGHGWKQIHSTFLSNTLKDPTGDILLDDSVWLAKYAMFPYVGQFQVDVPNGTYQVIARFLNREQDEFPGVAAEGRREIVDVETKNGPAIHIFDATVTDGQLNLEFIPYDWYIAGLEILGITNSGSADASDSFRVAPTLTADPLVASFEATGTDTTTTGLTYSWNFGDGSNGNGATATHEYASSGEYTVTLTVGNTSNRVVDFGGTNYVTGNVGILGVYGYQGIDLDNDGSNDDTLAKVAFSTEANGAFAKFNGKSAKFFGGIAGSRINFPAENLDFQDFRMANSSGGDYFEVRDQPGENSAHRAAILWAKSDFLNGGHAQQVSLPTNSRLMIDFNVFRSGQTARWMVQNGDQFFVSQSTITATGTYTVDPANLQWAAYDPNATLTMNFDQAAASYSAQTFDNVLAVGVLIERDSPGFQTRYGIRNFEADATLSPASMVVSVEDSAPNLNPIAADDAASTLIDTAVSIPVLNNDLDPEMATLEIDSVGTPSNGTAQEVGNTIVYTPANGFAGQDAFSYTISDGAGGFDTANVTVQVVQPTIEDFVQRLAFDETSGTTAGDSGPNGLAGTLLNGATFNATAGAFDGAVEFDGVNDLVAIGDSTFLNDQITPKRTVSVWFRADDLNKSGKQVIYEEGGNTRGLGLYLSGGSLYAGGWNASSAESNWAGTFIVVPGVQEGQWHHVALVLNGGPTVAPDVLSVYLDGTFVASGAGSQLWPRLDDGALGNVNGTTLFHDGSSTGSHPFDGAVDELRVFNRDLLQEEIDLLAAPSSGSWTYTEDFADGVADGFTAVSGTWTTTGGRYRGESTSGGRDVSLLDVSAIGALPEAYNLSATLRCETTGFYQNALLVFDFQDANNYKFVGMYAGADRWDLVEVAGGTATVVQRLQPSVIDSETDYSVRVEVDGGQVTVFNGTTQILSHNFGTPLNGGDVGFGADQSHSVFDDLVLEVPQTATSWLYSEDFSDGVADGFTAVAGTWTVTGGEYRGESSGGREVSIIDVSTLAPLSERFDVRASLRCETTGYFKNALLVFDYQDANNYKFVGMYAGADRWDLVEVAGGTATVVQRLQPSVIDDQTNYSVQVEINGGQVTVFNGTTQILSHNFGAVLNTGDVGFGVDQSHGTYDNFEIESF